MRQVNRKAPIPFRMSVILLCVLLCTLHLTSGLYARYTSAFSGSDDARVASFSFEDDLAQQTQIVPAVLSPGESKTTTVAVENTGEVTIVYSVRIENLTGNLPLRFSNADAEESELLVTSCVLGPGESGTVTFTLAWPDTETSAEQYANRMAAIRIVVVAEQLD